MKKHFLSIFNLAVRGLNLASKFILIVFLAKFLTVAELGLYGLIAATINFAMYFIGLDFYVYSNRELLKSSDIQRNTIVSSHAQLLCFAYLFALPTLSIIFFKDFLSLEYLIPFYGLIILEHLNQEFTRLLIVLKKPISSNLLLFVRSGGWSFIIIFLHFLHVHLTLMDVLNIWIVAEILCFLLSIILLYREQVRLYLFQQVNWSWIWKGLKICLPFMLGTLAVRAIFTGDRYILEYFYDANILAAYVFFASLAAATMSFMDAAVFSFDYPELVRSINTRDNKHRELIKKLYKKVAFLLILINLSAYVFIDLLLRLIGKDIFNSYLNYFYLLMLVQVLYAFSMIPHYILYALDADKPIIGTQISSLVIFLLFCFSLIGLLQEDYGIFVALLASFSFL
ncbi:hypothetical protein BS571_02055, partial [Acinetobacter baumannii]